jgi:hypothetical protein
MIDELDKDKKNVGGEHDDAKAWRELTSNLHTVWINSLWHDQPFSHSYCREVRSANAESADRFKTCISTITSLRQKGLLKDDSARALLSSCVDAYVGRRIGGNLHNLFVHKVDWTKILDEPVKRKR